ncbi:MAG: hypothetical protein R6U55_06120 [Desulfovermiculus sp.]
MQNVDDVIFIPKNEEKRRSAPEKSKLLKSTPEKDAKRASASERRQLEKIALNSSVGAYIAKDTLH